MKQKIVLNKKDILALIHRAYGIETDHTYIKYFEGNQREPEELEIEVVVEKEVSAYPVGPTIK